MGSIRTVFEAPLRWLANAFLPLFGPADADLLRFVEQPQQEPAGSITQLVSIGLVIGVLYLVWRPERRYFTLLTHLVVLLPFVGSTLGIIHLSEAYFVFALELLIYFGLFAFGIGYGLLTDGFGLLMGHRLSRAGRGDAPTPRPPYARRLTPKRLAVAFAHPLVGCLAILMFGVLTLAAVMVSIQVGGMAEYHLRFGKQVEAHGAAGNFRAHHDQMMRIKAHCLGDALPSRDALQIAAENKRREFAKEADWEGALRHRWQQDILWGQCTASQRSPAPWFMLLCLVGLLVSAWYGSTYTDDNAPSGTLTAHVGLLSIRLIFIGIAPIWLADLVLGLDHIQLATLIVLGGQRLLVGAIGFGSREDPQDGEAAPIEPQP